MKQSDFQEKTVHLFSCKCVIALWNIAHSFVPTQQSHSEPCLQSQVIRKGKIHRLPVLPMEIWVIYRSYHFRFPTFLHKIPYAPLWDLFMGLCGNVGVEMWVGREYQKPGMKMAIIIMNEATSQMTHAILPVWCFNFTNERLFLEAINSQGVICSQQFLNLLLKV